MAHELQGVNIGAAKRAHKGSLFQSLVVFAAYSAIIIAVFLFSGKKSEKTLYDKYLVKTEGAIIHVADIERAANFYNRVLDLPVAPASPQNQRIVQLPGRKRLFLSASQPDPGAAAVRKPAVLIRVKNGFEELHREFLKRSQSPAQAIGSADRWEKLSPAGISEIFVGRWGRQFAVCDPDGNVLLFYRPEGLFATKL